MDEIYSLVKSREIGAFKTSIYSIKLLVKYKHIFLLLALIEFVLTTLAALNDGIAVLLLSWALRIVFYGFVYKKIQEVYFKEWDIKYQQGKLRDYILKGVLISIIVFAMYFIFYIAMILVMIIPIMISEFFIIPFIILIIPISIMLVNAQTALEYEFIVNGEQVDVAMKRAFNMLRPNFGFIFKTFKLYTWYFIYSIPLVVVMIVIVVWGEFSGLQTVNFTYEFEVYELSPIVMLLINLVATILVVINSYAMFFGFVIMYMNKKYNDGENVFPDKFIQDDEEESNNDNYANSYVKTEEPQRTQEIVEYAETKNVIDDNLEDDTEIKDTIVDIYEDDTL